MAAIDVAAQQTSTRDPRVLLTNAIVASMFGVFAYVHVMSWIATGRPVGLVFALQEAVLVVMYVARRRTNEVSTSRVDWAAGVVGSFAPLLLRPAGTATMDLIAASMTLQVLGAGLSVIGALSLGRSFGIVAANRGVKDQGLYRCVRHPLYAAYLVTHIGFILVAFTPLNVLILAVTYAGQAMRIQAEERLLRNDPAYVAYTKRTKYRLVPGIY